MEIEKRERRTEIHSEILLGRMTPNVTACLAYRHHDQFKNVTLAGERQRRSTNREHKDIKDRFNIIHHATVSVVFLRSSIGWLLGAYTDFP